MPTKLVPYPYNNSSKPHLKWIVRVPEPLQRAAGKKAATFEKRGEAEAFIDIILGEHESFGSGALTLTDDQRLDALAALRLLDGKASLTDAVKSYLATKAMASVSLNCTELAATYHALMVKSNPPLSPEHKAQFKYMWKKFNAFTVPPKVPQAGRVVGTLMVGEVTTAIVAEFLRSRGDVAVSTLNGFRRYIHMGFAHCVNELKILKENPVSDIKKFRDDGKPKEILSPDQLLSVLRSCLQLDEPYFMWWVLLGAFAGIRPDEAAKAHWEHYKNEGPGWGVDLHKPLSYSHRVIPIYSPLSEWLAQYGPKVKVGPVVKLTEQQLRSVREKVAVHAGLDRVWPADVLRHSFCSYFLAHSPANGRVFQLQELMHDLGHAKPQMIEKNYRHRVESPAAREWWSITPQKVLGLKVLPEVEEAA